MKTILINPDRRSVEYVETPLELPDIYRLIGTDCFDTARPFGLFPHEMIFCDDMGSYKPELKCFRIVGYPWFIAGKTLVCGFGNHGESVSTRMTIEQVHDLIHFE